MPLEVLLVLVVGGIVGIAGLLHVSGLSARHRMADADEARRHWDDTYPDSPAEQAMLSATGEAALIRHGGGTGLVWAMGQDVAARKLTPGKIDFRETRRHLVLRTKDYTAPRIRLMLTQDERPVWRAALGGPAG